MLSYLLKPAFVHDRHREQLMMDPPSIHGLFDVLPKPQVVEDDISDTGGYLGPSSGSQDQARGTLSVNDDGRRHR